MRRKEGGRESINILVKIADSASLGISKLRWAIRGAWVREIAAHNKGSARLPMVRAAQVSWRASR